MSLMERVQLKLESEKIAEQKAKEQKQESFDSWKREQAQAILAEQAALDVKVREWCLGLGIRLLDTCGCLDRPSHWKRS